MMKNISSCLVLIMVIIWTHPSLAKKKESSSSGKNSASSFGMSPPVFDLECRAGEKKTISTKITNDNRVPINVTIKPVGRVAAGQNHLTEKPVAALPPDNLARNIVVESPVIVVPANSFKSVSVTLDVPPGLTGTQYAGLTATNATPADTEDSSDRSNEYEKQIGVGVRSALGISIKCQMVDTLKFSYELQNVTATPSQGNAPATIKVVMKNTGNAELKFFPILVLVDSSSKVVARLKGQRITTVIPLSVGEVEMAPAFSKIPPGQYKAVLTLAGSNSKLPPAEKSVTIGR